MSNLIIVILFIVIILLLLYIHRIFTSLKEISRLLKEYLSGNLSARLFFKGKGRLGEVARDIVTILERTNKKLNTAEQELQKMEAMLRGMSDGVLITDSNGIIILANRTFLKMLHVNKNIEGKQFLEVLRNLQLLDVFRNAMDTWEIISKEITVPRADKEIHLIATAAPVYSADAVSGIVFTLHDITRLKHLEEVRKDFVANVSHEIKSPVTAIKGFAEKLLDGALNDRDNANRLVERIKNHSERLNNLVEDLLTLSGLELGDIVIEKTEINPSDIIDNVFAGLKEKADKKGLYLKKVMPEDGQMIFADRNRLTQIMFNLVDNGIKFTEEGGVTAGLDRTDGRLSIFVQDTGIGISARHLERIGERFYRVDSARSRYLGGTGLGLAIVKHLVRAHGWEMKIESTPGKGTKVKIII
jgi:two-component system phosphate regulon sensor histidine kinase PhoR